MACSLGATNIQFDVRAEFRRFFRNVVLKVELADALRRLVPLEVVVRESSDPLPNFV